MARLKWMIPREPVLSSLCHVDRDGNGVLTATEKDTANGDNIAVVEPPGNRDVVDVAEFAVGRI